MKPDFGLDQDEDDGNSHFWECVPIQEELSMAMCQHK